MAYKLLHLADLHLDTPMGWIKDDGKRGIRRSEQRETLKKLLSLAEEKKVDAVLIAGDLFEQTNFRLDTLNFLRETFGGCPFPILIAAGNHDPLVEGSPYLTLPWPENVYIFKSREFETYKKVDGLVVHGASHLDFKESFKPLSSLKIPQDGRIHVILFHGSYLGWQLSDEFSSDPCFPFSRRELESVGAHYFALGHYHSFRNLLPEGIPLCYPGTPEPVSMEEEGDRFAVIIEVSGEGAPKVENIPIGTRKVVREEVDCSDAESMDEILEKLEERAFSGLLDGMMVKFVLRGELEPEVNVDPREIEEILNEKVKKEGKGPFFIRVRSEIHPRHDIDQLREEKSIRGEFVRLMLEKIEKAKKEGKREEERRLRRVLFYGLDAFVRREVRKR